MSDMIDAFRDPRVAQRFWSRVDKRGPDECWGWSGGKGSGTARGNYGRLYIGRGVTRAAHQYSWEIANGQPFPAGMQGCHSCDNPWCVNPAHIWPGTQGDNVRDAVAKGRLVTPYKDACIRGHDLTDPANRLVTKTGSRCAPCLREAQRHYMRKVRARRHG